MKNNNVLKGMLIALLAVYVISPVDLAPGPWDDLLLILFSYIMNQRSGSQNTEIPDHIEGVWRESSEQ